MEEVSKFILQIDKEIVTATTTLSMETSSVTVRTVDIGPLGFPPLPQLPDLPLVPDIQDLNSFLGSSVVPLATGLLGFFPLWFLIGK